MKKAKKMVALRMNPTSKKPSPKLPEGDEKFRLLVMGHKEPKEGKTGPYDAPVIGDATFRQMIGAGAEALDQQLKVKLAGRKCKPANKRQRQLWKKALVTKQEKFEAQQAEDGGSSNAAPGRKIVTGQAGQDFPGARRGNPSHSSQKHKCGTLGKHTNKASNMQGTVETVLGSGQKHCQSGQKGQKQAISTL